MTLPPTSRRTLVKGAVGLAGAVSLLALAGCGGGSGRKKPSTGDTVPAIPPGKHVDADAYGAVGDGVTDDTGALTKAVQAAQDNGGGLVVLRSDVTGYALQSLVIPSGVGLVCLDGQARLLKLGEGGHWLQTAEEAVGVAFKGLILETGGLVRTAAIQADTAANGVLIEACEFRGDLSNQAIGFECSPRTRNVTIRGSILQDFRTCIRINQCDSTITVDSCTMRGWSDRAITVRGTAAAAPTGVWITKNTIEPNAPGGISRQAIAFSNDHGKRFEDVHVNGNTVTGAGVDDKDPSRAGSADLVSLHQCEGFEVKNNVVTGSGEVGITISQGSNHGVVSGNTCKGNDTGGITIGSASSSDVSDIVVEGNTCVNNGRDYGGEPGADWAKSGIIVYEADRVTVRGNTLTTSAGGGQQYAVSVTGGTKVVVKGNKVTGTGKGILRRAARGRELGP